MNRLKELRQKRGLLQSDIAKIIEKSDRAVGQYERGERDPSSETWIKLANFFNVSLDYLLGKSNSEFNSNKIDNFLNEEMTLPKSPKCFTSNNAWHLGANA